MWVREFVAQRRPFSAQIAVFGVWLGITGFGAALTPDPSGHGTHTQLGLPPCPSALLFNLPCPGCGMTTSVTALLHGQWERAFSAHPLGPAFYAALTAAGLASLLLWLRRRPFEMSPRANRAIVAGTALFLLFGVYRAATHPGFASGPEGRYVQNLLR